MKWRMGVFEDGGKRRQWTLKRYRKDKHMKTEMRDCPEHQQRRWKDILRTTGKVYTQTRTERCPLMHEKYKICIGTMVKCPLTPDGVRKRKLA